MTTQKKSYTLPIVIMFALFFIIAFVTNLAGSMGVILKNQFGASNALSQLGTLANFVAYACMGIPAGIILKRKGYKVTALSAVVVGLVGIGVQFLAGYVDSSIAFATYVTGALIAGVSMCMLNIVVNPMLNTLGGGGNKGNQLIQFGGACNSIGGTLAPVLVGYLVGGSIATAQVTDAAPVMIIAMVIFSLAFVIFAVTKVPEPHMETPEEKAARKAGNVKKDKYGPMSFRHFVLGAIAIFFYVGVEVGVPNMANLYMSENPLMGPAIAGTMVGAYWFLMLCGRLIGGVVGGKVSSKVMLTTVSTIALAFILCLMYIPEDISITAFGKVMPLKMVFMTLTGLCTSVMWGAIFNLAAEGLGKYTPIASGIFMTLVVGGGVLPLVQGFVADKIGHINSYWVVIIGFAYILFYALLGSKNVNKDIPTE